MTGLNGFLLPGEAGSDKFFKFTLSDGNEGGLLADSTFSHAGIIINGFSAGVLQKTPPTVTTLRGGPYGLDDISGPILTGGLTWSGNIMRVEVNGSEITNVIGKSSTVTISTDGSFTGNDEINGDIQNIPASGIFSVPNTLERTLGNWENVADDTINGDVVVLITPDKEFLGSYSCDGAIRALDNCDFHLWQK